MKTIATGTGLLLVCRNPQTAGENDTDELQDKDGDGDPAENGEVLADEAVDLVEAAHGGGALDLDLVAEVVAAVHLAAARHRVLLPLVEPVLLAALQAAALQKALYLVHLPRRRAPVVAERVDVEVLAEQLLHVVRYLKKIIVTL